MRKRRPTTAPPHFTDAEFMAADEKRKVLKAWVRFVNGGFQLGHFTKVLYQHLIGHCSYIAHYSLAGFHATYFKNPEDTHKFLDQFDRAKGCVSVEYGMTYWLRDGNDVSAAYYDLNNAMVDTLEPHLPELRRMLKTKELEMAETQLGTARRKLEALRGGEQCL